MAKLGLKERIIMGEKEIIKIPEITLEWSEWYPWNKIKENARKTGIKVPEERGVYQVKYRNENECLTIGKSKNLRRRIKQQLLKGKNHSEGKKIIKNNEDVSQIVIRWAITDRPAAVEEELHRKHKKKFGKLPKYVEHT